MVVIYAEKGSLASAIAAVLGAGKRIPMKEDPKIGYWQFNFKGEDAVLCHGVGHLMQLVPAKSYDEKYAKWDLSVFPCIPDTFRIAPKSATKSCAVFVKGFLQKADWVINATDPDREGELIFAYVYQACGCRAPYKRAWIEDLTSEKIEKAFDNLIEPQQIISKQHKGTPEDLQKAGRARDIADNLIGTNLTVAATLQYGGADNLMGVGRVQTPTLAMVVQRERDILNFVKKPFWKLTAAFTTAAGETFEAEYAEGRFDTEAAAKEMLERCTEQGTVQDVTAKHRSESAPLLYNTTQLQIAASRKLGWEAAKTTKIAQQLYEDHLISYPRTSSEHLTEEMIPEVTLTLQKIMKMPEYSQYAVPDADWQKFGKRHFNNEKVGSHPAIIPTVSVPENTSGISDDGKLLYDLVVKSLLRIIYPKAELDETTVTVNVNDVLFRATGSVIALPGWYAVDALPEKKKALPAVSRDELLTGSYQLKPGETEPPKRYTEADLLAAMELAGQDIEDEEARTLMKLQKKGLGTDATRAAIIKGLFDKELIACKGKSIIPTEKGIWLIDSLPIDDIKSAELTGEWEMRLNNIAMGKEDYNTFISDIKQTTQEWYAAIAGSSAKHFLSSAEADLKCPVCGKPLRKMQFGYGCTGYSKDGTGCQFAFSNPLCGVKLTDKAIHQLLENKRTDLIKGFKSKKNPEKTFDAYLVVDPGTGNVRFEMNTDLNCPICGKPIRPVSFGYSCTGYSKDGTGCQFKIGREICGKKITDTQIRMLLMNGRTGLLKGFHSKKDPEKAFDAFLAIDKEKQGIKFEFQNK
ncbi:MAG: topoisomerase C-terminal repeat-containing protein [Oscillospiraceae bacterium]|nr:topoisomerase C-terminal repeat-containing protein [Oscillospiraceae bacterium]MBR3448404.1 topoisomerase C-terminal repeat-containing protein [Oscillospiraceae bacterium]